MLTLESDVMVYERMDETGWEPGIFYEKRYITIPMLILLLAPTILSLLMGAEFVHLPFQKVPTIIVNHDHSETVQSLIQMISDNRTFDVIACTDEEDDLKEAFYYNKALAGIVIPEHFQRIC